MYLIYSMLKKPKMYDNLHSVFSFSLHPPKKQQQKHLIAGNDNDMATPRSNWLLLGHENSKPVAA